MANDRRDGASICCLESSAEGGAISNCRTMSVANNGQPSRRLWNSPRLVSSLSTLKEVKLGNGTKPRKANLSRLRDWRLLLPLNQSGQLMGLEEDKERWEVSEGVPCVVEILRVWSLGASWPCHVRKIGKTSCGSQTWMVKLRRRDIWVDIAFNTRDRWPDSSYIQCADVLYQTSTNAGFDLSKWVKGLNGDSSGKCISVHRRGALKAKFRHCLHTVVKTYWSGVL